MSNHDGSACEVFGGEANPTYPRPAFHFLLQPGFFIRYRAFRNEVS
jgi:hypothetical protein